MNEDEAAFRESLLNTLAGTFSVNHQERSCAEDQLKIFETSEGESNLGQKFITTKTSDDRRGWRRMRFMEGAVNR